MRFTIFAALSIVISAPALAKPVSVPSTALINEDIGIPVFPYDITDRPYRIIGPVKAGVRKATIFSQSPSQRKIYEELWERAQKLGADAVVKAQYGDAHVTAFSWGKANATGVAIKFLPSETVTETKTAN
ncbi:hypothetical protein [Sphingobium phenoxybenzoativorans]|uniref:hypothetical protein n=1 Tax=Sphingobium phenoxybenzoativorans TaxID=1592790 RepID=UPI0008727A63|nr:hypothetical protein [Sphingobium phenoxybenzoativorans]